MPRLRAQKIGEDGLTTQQRWGRKIGADGLSNNQRRNTKVGKDGMTGQQRYDSKIGEDGLTNSQRYNAKIGEDGLTKKQRRNLRAKYSMSPEDFGRLMAEQAGACAICRGQDKKLCVDHCHRTGKVRALLCPRCNMGIGLFDDSSKQMTAAAEYLAKHGNL